MIDLPVGQITRCAVLRADDIDRQRSVVGADNNIALCNISATDPSGNRRDDFGVARLILAIRRLTSSVTIPAHGRQLPYPRGDRTCVLREQILRPRKQRLGGRFRGLAAQLECTDKGSP